MSQRVCCGICSPIHGEGPGAGKPGCPTPAERLPRKSRSLNYLLFCCCDKTITSNTLKEERVYFGGPFLKAKLHNGRERETTSRGSRKLVDPQAGSGVGSGWKWGKAVAPQSHTQ